MCVCVSAEFAAACVNPIMQLIFNHLDVVQIIFNDADQVTQTLLLLLQVLKDNLQMLHKHNTHTHKHTGCMSCLFDFSQQVGIHSIALL